VNINLAFFNLIQVAYSFWTKNKSFETWRLAVINLKFSFLSNNMHSLLHLHLVISQNERCQVKKKADLSPTHPLKEQILTLSLSCLYHSRNQLTPEWQNFSTFEFFFFKKENRIKSPKLVSFWIIVF